MSDYLIWSNEHAAWWKPNHMGYTPHLDLAGRYTRAEAIAISRRATRGWLAGKPPPELPVSVADAKEALAALASPEAP